MPTRLRAGLLVAGAIPFAMLVGFIGLLLVGYSGNVMSLGAIDFGLVVDGAVVVVGGRTGGAGRAHSAPAGSSAAPSWPGPRRQASPWRPTAGTRGT